MIVEDFLNQLYEEREALDIAIGAMERLAVLNRGKKMLGRLPKWLRDGRREDDDRINIPLKSGKPKGKQPEVNGAPGLAAPRTKPV